MSDLNNLFNQAQQSIPGGVNSPVRAFKSVGGNPIFIEKAKGAYIYSTNGNKYIDYVGSWGPMILGHAHDEVVKAVVEASANGLSFGAPTVIETAMAEQVKELYPSIDLVRMVSSGTEATMSAIRLARGFTGRNKLVKFEGCYHGHADSLLVKAGSGALTLGVPTSLGVPKSVANDTITLNYNDSDQVTELFAEMGNDIACVIVEPVAGNMNCIPPSLEFLKTLRQACDDSGAVLIFDEVMTGFRVALGGAQEYFKITPDLTTLGKVIGGGMPVGAFGGRRDIMECLSPLGGVYQAGTLSGNPLAMAAGFKTIELLKKPGFYDSMSAKTSSLLEGIKTVAESNQVELHYNQAGSMFGLFFTAKNSINNFADVMSCDADMFVRFFNGMLAQGVYLAPSAFEAGFVSGAHSEADISKTIEAADIVFSSSDFKR